MSNNSRHILNGSDVSLDNVIAQVSSALQGFKQLEREAQSPTAVAMWRQQASASAAVLEALEAIFGAGYDHIGGVGERED